MVNNTFQNIFVAPQKARVFKRNKGEYMINFHFWMNNLVKINKFI